MADIEANTQPPSPFRGENNVIVVGPDGRPDDQEHLAEQAEDPTSVAEMVEQPAKVMRIGSMIKQLERLSLPFAEDEVPSEAELRIAQAQLVGWLEGLFHGIQTALFAQQMAARAQ